MYLSGLVLPLVSRRGRRHPSPLKNGPGEVKNWKCAQNVATRALRGLCCLGFLHRISSAALLAPGAAATSERESCYWQLSIISFGNQFLLTPHISAFLSVRNDFVSPVSPVRAWSHSRVGGASPYSEGCLHSHSCPVSHMCDAFHYHFHYHCHISLTRVVATVCVFNLVRARFVFILWLIHSRQPLRPSPQTWNLSKIENNQIFGPQISHTETTWMGGYFQPR